MPKDKKQISLEKNIIHIENIIEQLDTDELTLNSSLEEFEKGFKLIRNCQAELVNAEQKIKTLTNNISSTNSGDSK